MAEPMGPKFFVGPSSNKKNCRGGRPTSRPPIENGTKYVKNWGFFVDKKKDLTYFLKFLFYFKEWCIPDLQ